MPSLRVRNWLLLNERDGERIFVGFALVCGDCGDNAENNHHDTHRHEHKETNNHNDEHGPDNARNEHGELKIKRGARVLTDERAAVFEHDVANERGKESEEDSTNMDQG